MKGHKSVYIVENTDKYINTNGMPICRSSWERALCKFFDKNDQVLKWSSEAFHIPYLCLTDNKQHRYFPDFFVEMKSGSKLLIEVKPKDQTRPPKLPKSGRRTKSYNWQLEQYSKNCSKWYAANQYCKNNKIKFAIWTEDTIRSLGIKI